jgi:DNA-binding response OmpR family regulator
VKILIVDDDADLLDLTGYALRRDGFTVVQALDGEQALQRWERENPDLVLLDANMPKLNGFEVCRRIRQASTTPVIMLTARDDEEDILQGLELGADDYVTKPFSAKQLIARIRAVIRRCQGDPYRQPVSELRAGDVVLDLQSHEARKNGAVVQLTPLEFRLLYMLGLRRRRLEPAQDAHGAHPVQAGDQRLGAWLDQSDPRGWLLAESSLVVPSFAGSLEQAAWTVSTSVLARNGLLTTAWTS